MWPAVKRGFSQEGFKDYVQSLVFGAWRPSKIVWHNTAAPSLAQWIKSAKADQAQGLTPGISRIKSLEKFFHDDNHWSGCPHLFVANDVIWVMNPLTAPGVHSPSWNSTSIGIEMIGDFSVEDDDSGEGLKVKQNTIFATAVLCSLFGLEPKEAIFLHKQDPKTTHDCPGKNIAIDKLSMISAVSDLMAGGEHVPAETAHVIAGGEIKQVPGDRLGTTTVDGLNFRRGPGVMNEATGQVPKGTQVTILDEARNGTSVWYKVRSPLGYIGWIAGKFVQLKEKEA